MVTADPWDRARSVVEARGWTVVSWASNNHDSTLFSIHLRSGGFHRLLTLHLTTVTGGFHRYLDLVYGPADGSTTSVTVLDETSTSGVTPDAIGVMLGTAIDWSDRHLQGRQVPAAAPDLPGITDLSLVANGSHSTVYRGQQTAVGREVAIKVEHRRLESVSDQNRFVREARTAGRMSGHPHVIDLFNVGVTEDGHPYMVMELCQGSFADRLPDRPLSETEARRVGGQMADALADAHMLGLVHGDVRPGNILITHFGEPALADFGIAALAHREAFPPVPAGQAPYLAPELLVTGREPGAASDVYALCATLYALLRGRPPGWPDQVARSQAALVDESGGPAPELPGISPGLTEILRRGMAKDPAGRPTAAELRDELARLGPGSRTAPPLRPIPVWTPSPTSANPDPRSDDWVIENDPVGGLGRRRPDAP